MTINATRSGARRSGARRADNRRSALGLVLPLAVACAAACTAGCLTMDSPFGMKPAAATAEPKPPEPKPLKKAKPVTADQVNEGNAHEKAAALEKEYERE